MIEAEMTYQIEDFALDLSISVNSGESLVLFGPSGAGKSTILRAIAGLIEPTSGFISIGGATVFDKNQKIWVPPYKRKIGYLTQQYHLFPHLSVFKNIAYGLSRNSKAASADLISDLLEKFQLSGLEHRYPWEISGGQQQRVALARALASNPSALLLDEPFASLDSELRRATLNEIRRILEFAKIPVIVVTHEREEAVAIGDEIQVIDSGHTLAKGEPINVLGHPGQERVASLIGVENLIPMNIIDTSTSEGTMTCVPRDLDGPRIEVPLGVGYESGYTTIGIRASDIILAYYKIDNSSARNQIQGVVSEINTNSPGYQITLNCSEIPLICNITGTSLSEMDIKVGSSLWAIFKASSCFIVRDHSETLQEITPNGRL